MAKRVSDAKREAGLGRSEPLRLLGAVLLVALLAADLLVHHTHVQKVLGFVLIAVLVHVTITDLEERRIKNRVTFPAAVAAIVIGLIMHSGGVPAQVVAGVATGAFLFLFALASRGGFGMGDVKLGAVLGLFLSRYVITALVAGLLASAVFSVGVLISRGFTEGRRTWIPLGPFLALGGVVAVLAGPLLQHST